MQRNTVQRQLIIDVLIELRTHPTVEDVYVEIHKKHPTISKATVYRNLHQLSEYGRIQQLFVPGDLDRFDGRTEPHYHFKCKKCGGVFDVDIAYLSELNKEVELKYGFQVEEQDFVFRGVCEKCKTLVTSEEAAADRCEMEVTQ